MCQNISAKLQTRVLRAIKYFPLKTSITTFRKNSFSSLLNSTSPPYLL